MGLPWQRGWRALFSLLIHFHLRFGASCPHPNNPSTLSSRCVEAVPGWKRDGRRLDQVAFGGPSSKAAPHKIVKSSPSIVGPRTSVNHGSTTRPSSRNIPRSPCPGLPPGSLTAYITRYPALHRQGMMFAFSSALSSLSLWTAIKDAHHFPLRSHFGDDCSISVCVVR